MKNKIYHALIADNLYEFYKQAALLNNLPVIRHEHFFMVRNSRSDWPQYILCDKTDGSNYMIATETFNYLIEKEGAPPVVLFPIDDDFPEMAAYPESFGLRAINRWNGMARSLENWNETEDNHEIFRVETMKDVADWTGVINKALFSGRKAENEVIFNLLKDDGIKMFIARHEKKAVATSMMFTRDGVAGLYFIATLEEYRGKGLGTSVTAAAMNAAKKEGCNAAILHATRLGEKIYTKLGFIPYRKFYIYWKMGKQYL